MLPLPRVAAAARQPVGPSMLSTPTGTARAPTGACATELCFHCGAPVPSGARWRLTVDDAEQAFCCAGCLAIAQMIRAAGLADFYVRRTAHPETPPEADDEWTHYDVAAEAKGQIARADEACEISLLLEGIRCAACVWLSESYVRRIPGVVGFSVNFATRRARLAWSPRHIR